MGMLTLGNTMSLLTKDKIKLEDPVSSVVYKQFRKVGLDKQFLAVILIYSTFQALDLIRNIDAIQP
jgi:hypothetical protein